MRTNHKRILILVFFIISFVCFISFFFADENLKDIKQLINQMASNSIVFIAISFGFYISSICALTGSNFKKSLCKKDENNAEPPIYTLRTYFYRAIILNLITIIFAFLLLFLTFFFNNYLFLNFILSIFCAILSLNFIFMCLIIVVLLNNLVKS